MEITQIAHIYGRSWAPSFRWQLLARPISANAALHRLKDLSANVSGGTGYRGTPKRFGADLEITLL